MYEWYLYQTNKKTKKFNCTCLTIIIRLYYNYMIYYNYYYTQSVSHYFELIYKVKAVWLQTETYDKNFEFIVKFLRSLSASIRLMNFLALW